MNIRRCELNDADNMLKMLLALDKETDYMMFEADERPKDNYEDKFKYKFLDTNSRFILMSGVFFFFFKFHFLF